MSNQVECRLILYVGYVGADSSLRFNHATHAARMSGGGPQRSDPKVIMPLRSGHLPPTTPENAPSSSALAHMVNIYLPDRDVCMRYVGRFLDEIHCLYWFYSSEEFYGLIDKTYEDGGASASASWMCSLYSIFALCSQRPSDVAGDFIQHDDVKTSLDYLSMAKNFVARTCDEADIESVRALSLLVLHSSLLIVTAG